MSEGPVPVRDAATIMLLRDSEDGFEVCMLRRSAALVFAPSAYVFPGGAVDQADRVAARQTRDDAGASAILGLPEGGLAFWVAAARECFEEAGVLLGRPVPDAAWRERHRRLVHAHQAGFLDVCASAGVTLDLDAIHYFAHFITPAGGPRRFDTRFFVAAAPVGQEPLHDDREAVDTLWIRPAVALDRYDEGDFELIPPTLYSLEVLALFDSTAEVLDEARTIGADPDAMPRVPAEARTGPAGGGICLLRPGTEGYRRL